MAYTVSCVALGILSPYGWVASHILGCCFAKFTSFYTEAKIRKENEFGADQLAASKSNEIATGAIENFTEKQKENLEKIKKVQRDYEKKKLNLTYQKWIPNLPLLVSISASKITVLTYNIIITSKGDPRFYYFEPNPCPSERKRKIEQMLSNSPND